LHIASRQFGANALPARATARVARGWQHSESVTDFIKSDNQKTKQPET